MESDEYRRLRYRRQYIIAPEHIGCPFEHRTVPLTGSHQLYHHVDLLITVLKEGDLKIILLGDMFDFEVPGKNNSDILNELMVSDYKHFLEKIAKYTGRFVLIYMTSHNFYIVTDATAARKAYYCNWKNKIWLASQSHLLAKTLGFKKTEDKSKIRYYDSKDCKRINHANIGNTTYYDDIYQLIPNHYLDVNQFKVHRFWPSDILKIRPYEEVAFENATIIKGYMEAIASRYNIMLPVTAGFDSRLLLSGTKDIKEKVYYYINRNIGVSEKKSDIRIPVQLFKKLKLTFHILELNTEIDEEFKSIYFHNNPFAAESYLPHVYNYYKNFSNRVNLPGNYAADPFKVNVLSEKNVTPHTLATLYKSIDYTYDVQYYAKWLKDCQEVCREYKMDIVRLFYWEERIANFGTHLQLDKDIAQEDINPFNSRLLLVNYFSVEKRYNNRPDKLLSKKTIEILWPELLTIPINPSISRYALNLLAKCHLLGFIYGLRHKTAR